jgi:hypothetical protein
MKRWDDKSSGGAGLSALVLWAGVLLESSDEGWSGAVVTSLRS